MPTFPLGSSPITGVIIGERHEMVDAPLLLRYLHPHLANIFQCHLVEHRDDIDETELLKRLKVIFDTIMSVYEAIREEFSSLKEITRIKQFTHEIFSKLSSSRREEMIDFLKKNNRWKNIFIPKNVTFRIPRIMSLIEQQKLFNEVKLLNFNISGIDHVSSRELLEDYLAKNFDENDAFSNHLLKELISETRENRDNNMLGHLTVFYEAGKKCTTILGANHVRRIMGKQNYKDSWITLLPPTGIHGNCDTTLPLQQCEGNSNVKHLFSYQIKTPDEAEKAALALFKYINASYSKENLIAYSKLEFESAADKMDIFFKLKYLMEDVTPSIRHGVLRGLVNLTGHTAKIFNKSKTTATIIQYTTSLLGYFLLSYYENSSLQRSDNSSSTMILALQNIAFMAAMNILMLTVCYILKYFGNYAAEHGWNKTGSIFKLGNEYAQYGIFAMDAKQRGIVAAASSVAAGYTAQSVVETVGNKVIDRVLRH